MEKGIPVLKAEQTHIKPKLPHCLAKGTKAALWWLRHFEAIIQFWWGFSWVWVIGILLCAVTGYLSLGHALGIILLIGVIANAGIYFSIRTLVSYLKHLDGCPDKEEAHQLMTKIIKRRVLGVR